MVQLQHINPPLTNLQMELLDLFTLQLPEQQLLELRRIISLYLLEHARDEANKVWKEKGYDEHSIQQLLSSTPFNNDTRRP